MNFQNIGIIAGFGLSALSAISMRLKDRDNTQVLEKRLGDDRPEKIRATYEGMLVAERKQTSLAEERQAAAQARADAAEESLDSLRGKYRENLETTDEIIGRNRDLKQKLEDSWAENEKLRRQLGLPPAIGELGIGTTSLPPPSS